MMRPDIQPSVSRLGRPRNGSPRGRTETSERTPGPRVLPLERMAQPKFSIGQIVHHAKFDYRGVVYDVDGQFGLSDEWYEQVARSRPPKDKPWYRVLVHGGDSETYVAERHLEPAKDTSPIEHPMVHSVFDGYRDGTYVRDRSLN
jgi:heat shock protein HspQ